MNYFEALAKECEELNQKGQDYLDTLSEEISVDEAAERIYNAAKKIFEEKRGNAPEWILDLVYDGFMPYYGIPKNGSLRFILGFSIVAQEAKLRNLLEIVEGRENKGLDFPACVPKDFYDKYEVEAHEPKKKKQK